MKSPAVPATFVLGLALLLAGCHGSAVPPTAPTSAAAIARPAAPAQMAVTSETWHLTRTLESIIGPNVCWAPRANVGTSIVLVMAVQRSNESVRLIFPIDDYPTDHQEYLLAERADDFTATGQPQTGSFTCSGSQFDYRFVGSLRGRFSADGLSLTASEAWSYQLTSGETVEFHFAWTATRQ